MSLLLKDPEAVLDYQVDWGAEYLNGDALARSRWTVSPDEVLGVSVVEEHFDLLAATVKVGGGEAGKLYRLTNHVVTAGGREDCRSIIVRVEDR